MDVIESTPSVIKTDQVSMSFRLLFPTFLDKKKNDTKNHEAKSLCKTTVCMTWNSLALEQRCVLTPKKGPFVFIERLRDKNRDENTLLFKRPYNKCINVFVL